MKILNSLLRNIESSWRGFNLVPLCTLWPLSAQPPLNPTVQSPRHLGYADWHRHLPSMQRFPDERCSCSTLTETCTFCQPLSLETISSAQPLFSQSLWGLRLPRHASRMADSVVVPLWVSPQCSPLAEVRCSCGFSIGLIVDARSVSEQRSDWAERRERRL